MLNNYYYNKNTNGNSWQTFPSNTLSIERLLNGRPHWLKYSGIHKAKKTLILNIMKINFLEIYYSGYLSMLQYYEFPIYIFIGSKFVKYDKNLFIHGAEYEDVLTDLQAIDSKILTQLAMAKLNLIYDQILILDVEEIEDLENTYSQLENYKKHDYICLNSDHNYQPVNQLLHENNNQIKALHIYHPIDEPHSPTDNCSIEDWTFNSLQSFTALYLAYDNLYQLIMPIINNITDVYLISNYNIDDIISAIVTNKKMKSIILEVHNCIRLQHELNFPALEVLIMLCKHIIQEVNIAVRLTALTRLDIVATELSPVDIFSILAATPMLEYLDLRNIIPINIDPTMNLQLPNLQSLHITLSSKCIHHDSQNALAINSFFKKIIEASPNLTRLTLQASEGHDWLDIINFTITKLPKLNHLNLIPNVKKHSELSKILHISATIHWCNQKITPDLLQQISNANILKLENCTFASAISSIPAPIILPSLYDLTLTDPLTSKQIIMLLLMMPNLRSLTLNNCEGIIDIYTLEESNTTCLPLLTELVLINVSINLLTLKKIFRMMPSIKDLSLDKDANLEDINDCILEEELAPNLTKISLTSCTITLQLLRKLINCAPKIDKIIFDNDNITSGCSISMLAEISRLDVSLTNLRSKAAEERIEPTLSFNNQQYMDADTTYKSQCLQAEEIFIPLHDSPLFPPAKYRLDIFTYARTNPSTCSINEAFIIGNNTDDVQIQEVALSANSTYDPNYIIKNEEHHAYYGKHQLKLTLQWQALPSISANEKLITYNVKPFYPTELSYSESTNQYYVRIKPGSSNPINKKFTIDFILEVPILITQKTITYKMIQTLKKFKDHPLQIQSTTPNGNDYARYMMEQKTGSCRHRAILHQLLCQKHNVNMTSRIIMNKIHAFVEIQYEGSWHTIDLGGYPAKVNIAPLYITNIPTIEDIQTNVMPNKTHLLSNGEEILEDSLNDMLELHGNILIKSQNTNDIAIVLQNHFRLKLRPFFYIDSPEELICSAKWLQLHDDQTTGTLQTGPGGAFYRFLAKELSNRIVIINYNEFTSSDMARFNTILDKTPHATGTLLPEGTQIFGLIDTQKHKESCGLDFDSRFMQIKQYKTRGDIQHIYQGDIEISDACHIELYNDVMQTEQLLGSWSLDGSNFHFNPSLLLQKIIEGNATISLSHAPWENARFVSFWQQAFFNKAIDVYGKTIRLPDDFVLYKNDLPYNFELYAECIEDCSPEIIPEHVLNPGTIATLFNIYDCREGYLYQNEGLISQHKNNTLQVYVTHDISAVDWLKILTSCALNNVKLRVKLAHNITLPAELGKTLTNEAAPSYGELENLCYIQSDDIDATVAIIASDDDYVIDISEVDPSNLIRKIDAQINDTGFYFTESAGVLTDCVQNSQGIILTGKFRLELQYALYAYLYEQRSHINSRILLLSDEPNLFPFLSQVHISLPQEAFDKTRFITVAKKLSVAPFIFLTGMSGIGKTSFIQKIWGQYSGSQVYMGIDAIELWANDTSAGLKTLFIDEANIHERNWGEFSSMLRSNPGILLKNRYFKLTSLHKVVFAYNPASYGGGRNTPKLFTEHPDKVIKFEPLPIDYITRNVLQRIFADSACRNNIDKIIAPIVAIAAYLTNCSTDDILITPRELSCMALLTRNYYELHGVAEDVLINVAAYYAYHLSKNWVPAHFRAEFEHKFKIEHELAHELPSLAQYNFLNLPSQYIAKTTLHDFLCLRKYQSQYSMLGGLIFEGEPGIGKTELVINTLKANNITYQYLPVGDSYERKERLLLEAFDAGEVVVIDEINTSYMMETLLNALLMGHKPDGSSAQNPGFFLIGTQNPTTMPGRLATSPALRHRLLTLQIPNLKHNEMLEVLVHIGLDENAALTLIQTQSAPICLRVLLNKAAEIIKESGNMEVSAANMGFFAREDSNQFSALEQVSKRLKTC